MAKTIGATRALVVSTVAFAVCFAAWIINAVLVTYLVSNGIYRFDAGQVGWLLALPILTGAITRVPLGILTDKYGGRPVMFCVMLLVAVPLFLLSFATTYTHFLLASLGFGLAGGSFAVGVSFVSTWYEKAKQGTALGIFGMGNAGAAATTLLAPTLLGQLTDGGANPEGWRNLPRVYAVLVALTAVIFFLATKNRRIDAGAKKSLGDRLSPLKSIIVWRFGLYYFFVFGAFVSLAQWIVPYATNVYGLTVAGAGLLASAFSLPSGIVRAAGGWLSDKYGARTVMYWVFGASVIMCSLLAIPRMQIESSGKGINATAPGMVEGVSDTSMTVGGTDYPLTAPPDAEPQAKDDGSMVLPQVATWQEPIVEAGTEVGKKQLIARGVTKIYYPANLWIFAVFVVLMGVATGIGKAGVFKFIPDQFPNAVGAVGGMVGLLGALGGFILPPVFGYLLQASGLWASCWLVLAAVALVCLIWMHVVTRRIMQQEAPDLSQLIERRPELTIGTRLSSDQRQQMTVRGVLSRVPFFHDLSKEQLKLLIDAGTITKAEAGEPLFSEGDPGDSLFVILQGSVSIHQGKNTLATLEEGEFFGELALLDGEPRSADATAKDDCELLVLGRKAFLDSLNKSPRMVSVLLLWLSHRMREITKRVQGDGAEEEQPWSRKDKA